jgi:Uma2 family endonuclease
MAMAGGSVPHGQVISPLAVALANGALANGARPPSDAFASGRMVLTGGRVGKPGVTVACGASGEVGDPIMPNAVFELLSLSRAATDRRAKASEYASLSSVQVYVIQETERPEISVLRRSIGWEAELVASLDAELALPETEIVIPLSDVYGT